MKLSDLTARLRAAVAAYEADPVDARDRPQSWNALKELCGAARALVTEPEDATPTATLENLLVLIEMGPLAKDLSEAIMWKGVANAVRSRVAALEAENARLREALADYGEHERGCILSRGSAGRPTADGGYERKYGDQWYEAKPVDKTPPCTCGLAAALSTRPEEPTE